MKGDVREKCLPRLGENGPGGRDQGRPFTRGKEQGPIDQAVEDPEDDREEVPVATQTQIILARQC